MATNMMMIMIPIPPNHEITLRQKATPREMDSTSSMTDAPVEVNPDIDSKKASVKSGVTPLNKNGRQPPNVIVNHPNTIIRIPSRFPRDLTFSLEKTNVIIPTAMTIIAEMNNAVKPY